MTAGAWTAVGALITLLGTGLVVWGGILTARGGRRASPYDSIVKRVMALEQQREEDRAEIEALQDEVHNLKGERAHALTEITSLQRRVAGMYDDRDDLVRYITILRAWVASGAKPPAPAVPEHLADVVPEWVPGDGAEPPRRRD